MAAYRYLTHRMYTLPLDKEQQDREWHHVVNTAQSNNIPQTLLFWLRHRIQRKYSLPKTPNPTPTTKPRPTKITKWATFTYTSPQIRKITNLFKHTSVRIAHKCPKTISHLSKPTNKETHSPPPTSYDRSGIYKITCTTCNKAYVGQTSRNLRQRYKERVRYIKNNKPQSAYAIHILNNKHEYGQPDRVFSSRLFTSNGKSALCFVIVIQRQ